jgi:hypothetical protein
VHEANTVPPTVTCSPDVPPGAGTFVVDGAVPVDALVDAGTGAVPGDAEASTRDTARKPRPTAAAADAVHAAPSAMVRFMVVRVMVGPSCGEG